MSKIMLATAKDLTCRWSNWLDETSFSIETLNASWSRDSSYMKMTAINFHEFILQNNIEKF